MDIPSELEFEKGSVDVDGVSMIVLSRNIIVDKNWYVRYTDADSESMSKNTKYKLS